MKSEVCRITGSSMQGKEDSLDVINGMIYIHGVAGTLRWKAPELLDGTSSLTPATDVYAYAIVCIEVLTMGDLPWAHDDDDDVRHNVLGMFQRIICYHIPLRTGRKGQAATDPAGLHIPFTT